MAEVADVWVAPAGAGSTLGIAAFAPSATATLARLPGVTSVGLYRAGLLDVADQRAWVLGEPPDVARPIPSHQILEGAEQLAERRVRAGGWAAISQALADRLNVEVGQRLTLPTPEPVGLRVAAIITNLGWSSGAIILNATDFARAWGSDAIAAYHVHLARGARAADVGAAVKAALGPRSALRIETAGHRAARQHAAARSGLSRLRQIAELALIAAVLAMSVAMIGLLLQHRPSVAERKQHGLASALLWRSLVVETVVLFGTGALAGGVFGLLGQTLCTRGLQAFTGFPVIDDLQLDIAGGTTALVIAASALVVIVPGYLVARVPPPGAPEADPGVSCYSCAHARPRHRQLRPPRRRPDARAARERADVVGLDVLPGAYTDVVGSIADRALVRRASTASTRSCTRRRCTSRTSARTAARSSSTRTSPAR